MHEIEIDAAASFRRGLEEIRTRGFTIVEKVVTPDEIRCLRDELEDAISSDPATRGGENTGAPYMIMNLMTKGDAFIELLENATLHAYFDALLGETCVLYAYTSSSMPPGGTNYSNRIHVDCPRFIPGYVSNLGVTLALDDFTDANGATFLLPESFGVEAQPSAEEFERGAQRAYPKAGDAIVFNARTWHRGGDNLTSSWRHAVTMNVCRSYMRQQFDFPRLVDPAVVSKLAERGRRFLGFNVRMPISLEEYYLPAEHRPYKPNQG